MRRELLWIGLMLASAFGPLGAAESVGAAEPPLAVPVDGEPFPAELTAVDASWQVTFSAGGTQRTLPAADLVAWGTCRPWESGSALLLSDGSLIAAEVLEADKQRVAAESELFGTVKLPLESVAGIIFAPPAERNARDLLVDQITRADHSGDRLRLVNGDELAGRVDSIRHSVVRLDTDVGPLEVKTERVTAVVFDPDLRRRAQPTGLHALAGWRDGSRLLAQQLATVDGGLRLTDSGGMVWTGPVQELVFLQPLGGRAVYLSDLKPEGYRHVPFLDLSWPFQADRNVKGGMLRAGGQVYPKGLGMHSAAQLSYGLGEPFRRFQAEAAIDDQTEGLGSVRLRVLVDGREKYASPMIRGGTPPVPVSVDMAGAKRLELVVEYGERADQMDHVDWINARLIR